MGLTSLLCSVPSKPCVSTLASSITYKPNWLHSSYLRQHQTSCCVAVEGKVLGQLGYDAFKLDSPDELPLTPPTNSIPAACCIVRVGGQEVSPAAVVRVMACAHGIEVQLLDQPDVSHHALLRAVLRCL